MKRYLFSKFIALPTYETEVHTVHKVRDLTAFAPKCSKYGLHKKESLCIDSVYSKGY